MGMLQSALGLVVFVVLAWVLGENRSRVSVRTILLGIGGQLLVALILLKLPFFRQAFMALNSVVLALEEATRAGTSLVFGYLGGGPLPFEVRSPGNLFILGFRALPLVMVVSALSSLLF
jgi:CNT family concentrative nucleoside transporter